MIEIKGEKYYTAREVAEKFSVKMITVAKWRQKGKLHSYKINERKFVFSETELEAFVKGVKNEQM